jgi:NAD/NADP transhydrogenase beta subunit
VSSRNVVDLAYLVATALFVFSLHWMNDPKTARKGVSAGVGEASPIFGMPIIDADKARTCLAIKRSMNPGFAGIENELYYSDRTFMLFGDAKAVVSDLVKTLAGRSAAH